ncbi:MAG: hypothetical protein AAGC93_30165 [Cyanobacteria bacterium P01_F01_bin.53]
MPLSKEHENIVLDVVTSGLQKVFSPDVLKDMVTELKAFFNKEKETDEKFDLSQSSFEILCYCASRVPYSEFYEQWYRQSSDVQAE